MTTNRLFFDIETLANPETCALMPEPKAPANYSDPVKISRYIEDAKAEAMDKAALDPDYGKVLSIGIFSELFYKPVVAVYLNSEAFADTKETEDENGFFIPMPEAAMLDCFWSELKRHGGNCVGYNILGFDLPYLMRRSMALGVKIPFIPNLAKFRTEPVTDLMMILYSWGADRYKGLKQVAKLYGIPNDCPDVDGSKVKSLDAETLRAYQVSDVKLVMALYDRMNGVYFQH